MKSQICKKIENYIRAGFPCLALNTDEETSALKSLKGIAENLDRKLWAWSVTRGIVDLTDEKIIDQTDDPQEFIRLATSSDNKIIMVMLDPEHWMQNDLVLVRKIKDCAGIFKNGKTLILLSTANHIPGSIKSMVTEIDIPLPSKEDLGDVVSEICTSAKITPKKEDFNRSVEALMGLTTDEASDAAALSIIETKQLSPEVMMREKCNQLAKKDALKVITDIPEASEVGGLNCLKEWIQERTRMFSDEAKEFGLPMPKGFMLIGPPGTGKSLVAKTVAGILRIPLVKFDFGACMDSLVGNSERNLRLAIQTAEAMAPCVLWVDEIDKQLGSSSDGHEVTKRMMSSMLTWLQEKKSPVFIIATANNIQVFAQSYPELLRKGRWDEIWMVDLPNPEERARIFEIHIQKFGRKPWDCRKLAELAEGFTGAEIEAACSDAMFKAFAAHEDDGKEMIDHLSESVKQIVPQSKMARDAITNLREWAKGRARYATTQKDGGGKGRLIE